MSQKMNILEEIVLLMQEFIGIVQDGGEPPVSLQNEIEFKLVALEWDRGLLGEDSDLHSDIGSTPGGFGEHAGPDRPGRE